MRFSGLKVIKEGLTGNRGWRPHWRDPDPKDAYDMVIIGGGGHGLATAYYLAKEHGITNVAVLEKGYLGGGNVGRNTTIVRANYFLPGNSEFYSHSLKLWESMEEELNFNVMHSQRGLINLFHSDGQRDAFARRGNAMVNQGDDAILLDREGVRQHLPYLDFENTRFPIYGGLYHPRGGTARHDAVAWGYARGADARGVDLIQNCAVTGIDVEQGRVTGVQTTRGAIRAKKVGVVVAGRSSQVAAMAGLRLLGRMLNRIRIKFNGQLAYSVVTQRMVDDTGASWDDKKGFVNYVLSIDGVKAAVLFSEVSDGAKISFRSESDTHVDEWARAFDGGGHRNASGAYVKGNSFSDVIADVIGAAPRFIDFDFEDSDPLSDEDASRIAELMKSPTR